MNVRVLLVLAALLVAGVVAPKKKRPWGLKGCNKVQNNIFAMIKGPDKDGYERVILNPKAKVQEKKGPRRTLYLQPAYTKFRHVQGTTGEDSDERMCSPWVGRNEDLFVKGEAACPQLWADGPWTKYKKGAPLSMITADGDSAYAGAHVKIEIQVNTDPEVQWEVLPGNWIIPVSRDANIYANRVKDVDGKPVTPDIDEEEAERYLTAWHGLRRPVTAIQCGAATKHANMPRPVWVSVSQDDADVGSAGAAAGAASAAACSPSSPRKSRARAAAGVPFGSDELRCRQVDDWEPKVPDCKRHRTGKCKFECTFSEDNCESDLESDVEL